MNLSEYLMDKMLWDKIRKEPSREELQSKNKESFLRKLLYRIQDLLNKEKLKFPALLWLDLDLRESRQEKILKE